MPCILGFGFLCWWEMIYVRVSLVGIDWVRKQQKAHEGHGMDHLGMLAFAVGQFCCGIERWRRNKKCHAAE